MKSVRKLSTPHGHAKHADATASAGAHKASADPGVTYTCPMHPEVQQTGPGHCPKCGMALEPILPSRNQTTAANCMP